MKLSPPICILALVGSAFATMAMARATGGCSDGPDGAFSWRQVWARLRPSEDGEPCDPWAGTRSTQPVTLVKITPPVRYWLMQIAPDGRGYIALYKPDWCRGCDIPEPLPTEMAGLKEQFTVLEFKDPATYRSVFADLAPLRDYIGNRYIKEIAGQVDKLSIARSIYSCDPKAMDNYTFFLAWDRNEFRTDNVSAVTPRCNTQASRAASLRLRRAIVRVAAAAHVPALPLLWPFRLDEDTVGRNF